MMLHHIFQRDSGDSSLLRRGARFGRRAIRAPVARLDFDEHQRPAVPGNDIDFSTPASVAPGNNRVPAPFELRTREIFAGFSQGDALLGHVSQRRASLLPKPLNHEDTKGTKNTKNTKNTK